MPTDCIKDKHYADWENYDELYVDDNGIIVQVADCQCSKKIYQRLFECVEENEMVEK